MSTYAVQLQALVAQMRARPPTADNGDALLCAHYACLMLQELPQPPPAAAVAAAAAVADPPRCAGQYWCGKPCSGAATNVARYEGPANAAFGGVGGGVGGRICQTCYKAHKRRRLD